MASAIEMSVSDWIAVKDNPRQRNTERRANIAKTKHLSSFIEPHAFVFAAVHNGNILCKIDGHTRALLWETGELEHPPSGRVIVCLLTVSGMKEAKYLYDCLDAPTAVKQPCDFVFGATRENNFRLRSALLRQHRFATQLKLADSGKNFSGDVYELVRKWKPELMALDSLGLTSNYTILVAAMLLTIRRDGLEVAGEFWRLLDDNKGTKTAAGMDGVEALHQHMLIRRGDGTIAGYDNLIDILGRCITTYVAWRQGRRLKSVRTTNFAEWVNGPARKEKVQ